MSRAARALWASGFPVHPRSRFYIDGADQRVCAHDTGRVHGPRQCANQDGPQCASWYVDGLAAGGQRVAPSPEIGRHIDFWPADS